MKKFEGPYGESLLINLNKVESVCVATHSAYDTDCVCLFLSSGRNQTVKGTIEDIMRHWRSVQG